MNPEGRPALASSPVAEEEIALAALPVDESSTATRQRLETLGAGPAGETSVALDFRRNRRVAVKTLPPSVGERTIEAFVSGARRVAGSSTADLATIFDVEREEGDAWTIVRAYVPGRNVRRLVEEDATLSQNDLYRLFAKIADRLARLHRRGIVHGNLKDENVIVAPNGEPVFTDLALHEGATYAADLVHLGRMLEENAVRRRTRAAESFSLPESTALRDIASRAAWAGQGGWYRNATEFATDIRRRLLGERDVESTRRFWLVVRPAGFLTTGTLLILVSLFFAAFNLLVGLVMYGPGFLGLLLQNIVMQSAPTFIPGAYLVIAGLRSSAAAATPVGVSNATSEHPSVLARRSIGGESLSAGGVRSRTLSVSRKNGRTVWTRSLGSAPSIVLFAISLGLGIAGIATAGTLDIPPTRTAEALRLAGIATIAIMAVLACAGSWRWGVRRATLDGKSIGLDRLDWRRRLTIGAAGILGRERLTLDDTRLAYELRGPLGVVRREIPRNAVWDVAYGTSDTGVEIAATGKPLRIGRGLSHDERADLAEELKRALDPTASEPEPVQLAKEPGRRIDATAFWIYGVCLALPLALFELPLPGVVPIPTIFAPDHELHVFERATQYVTAIAVAVGTGAVALGGWRLSRGLAGGRGLFQFGYYLRLGTFTFLGLVAAIVTTALGADVAPPSQVTPAMNLGAAAVSSQLVLGGIGALWLYARRDDPRLP